jgi:hypothetical protein
MKYTIKELLDKSFKLHQVIEKYYKYFTIDDVKYAFQIIKKQGDEEAFAALSRDCYDIIKKDEKLFRECEVQHYKFNFNPDFWLDEDL